LAGDGNVLLRNFLSAMSLPVMKPDRSRALRVKPEGLAYVNIEPDNGGILLNISEGGLCFHSVAPVQPGEAIHFWFSAEGNRIEADGRLAWIDEKGKTGGLQFKSLSPQAHQRIRNWMAQSTEPFAAERKPAAPIRPLAAAANVRSTPRTNTIVELGPAVQRVFSQLLKAAMRRGEFSRGLATGLLVGLVVAAAFLFHTHHRQVGELLIRMGERFAPTSEPQALRMAPKSFPTPVPEATGRPRSVVPTPASKPAPRAQDLLSQLSTKALASPPTLKPEKPSTPIPPIPLTATLPSSALAASSLLISSAAGKILQPESVGQPNREARMLEVKPTVHPAENAEDIAEVNSGVPLGKYFEIGRFKDELRAHEATEDLDHFGFRTLVVPKNLLWLISYQVLVGPYRNDEEAQAGRRSLESQGFKPHSPPRRSRELRFAPPTEPLRNADVLVGDFIVSWESYSPEATVKFLKGDNTVVTGRGTWVKHQVKYESDGVAYQANDNGSRTLLEIWFRGMSQSVVLSPTSDNRALNF
jgi:PilZ domain